MRFYFSQKSGSRKRVFLLSVSICGLLLFLMSGCNKDYIPNTTIEDTEQNRELIAFIDKYRNAVESRDMALLLSLTSINYFDDMGTPLGDDDVDYQVLKEGLMRLRKEILDTRYQIRYHGLTYLSDRILIDILYTGWYQVNTQDGPQWRRVLEPHRLVVAKEGGRYKIISGM